MIIWGKRSYGSVKKVGTVSVKTVFGHLYFLPLIPMGSYYVDSKNDAAFELNSINARSVTCGYLRMWGPAAALAGMVALPGPGDSTSSILPVALILAGVAAFIASYVFDKKVTDAQEQLVRNMMQRHFGLAVDPHECAMNLQGEITQRMQAHQGRLLEENWYRQALGDQSLSRPEQELAFLRARCERHDKPLQQAALDRLPQLA